VVSALLDAIWGIAAVSKSHFFVDDAAFILSGLSTWGWVAIGFAAAEVLAAFSIWRGGAFGRWFGIVIARLAIVAAMMSIPAYPVLVADLRLDVRARHLRPRRLWRQA
jgi:hypothetical protein